MGSVIKFIYQKFVLSLFIYFHPLFGFITKYLFRFKWSDKSKYSEIVSEKNIQRDLIDIEPEPGLETECESKQDVIGSMDSEDEEETPFKFKFSSYEEFSKSMGRGDGDSSSSEVPSSTYEFISKKSFSRFLEELEVLNSNAKKVDTNTNVSAYIKDEDIVNSEAESVHEIPENLTTCAVGEEVAEKIEGITFIEEKEQSVNPEDNLQGDEDGSEEITEIDSFTMESDSESLSSKHLDSFMSPSIDSYSDGFLSDGDFGGEFELDSWMDGVKEKVELHDEMSDLDENQESDDFDEEEDSVIMEELKNLEETNLKRSDIYDSEFLSAKDFQDDFDKLKNEDQKNYSDNSEKAESKDSLETLWEHQELIEQLKMELKKVRATGLPTILEESESPKIMEDLKPWKIDEKFQREDCISELHKFYKTYKERMRKFDILNYQKMYAIGFLQLKDPLQSSVPSITSIFSQKFSLSKRKNREENDPMMKFIKELQSELEVVYVGQMCLSWEFLHWQYGKALDLWEADPRGIHRYNEIAGEFQQFQVLMQRFIEDEPFHGARVQNYLKNRCVLRNLLQVPLIREDSSKTRKKERTTEKCEYAITSDMLVEILEESIRIFWRFVRADKECSSVIVKGSRKGTPVELQDPADSELLIEIRKNLHKKERKLKDLLRSGNCILRRFRNCREDNSDQVFYFFSQVDIKLVSRVLNMSRITTEQLVWCRNKLSKINFVNRKIQVEASFLLFPC